MKKIFSIVIFAVLILVMSSCAYPQTGDTWDGNYLYYNGYKTKTNSNDEIYYLTEFVYSDKTIKIDSFTYTKYYLGALHLIVKDSLKMNYYLRYDAESNSVLNVYADDMDISFNEIKDDYISLICGDKVLYVCKWGVFPAVNLSEKAFCKVSGEYLVVNKQKLKYAKYNCENFTEVSDTWASNYVISSDKLYYKAQNKFNIYDINLNQNHSFEIEGNFKALFENGVYLTGQYYNDISEDILLTMESYGLYSPFNNFALIKYDDNYNKITTLLPQEYDFSYNYSFSNGIINLTGYEYKVNGIISCHCYNITDNLQLRKGTYTASENTDNEQETEKYSSNKCGDFSYKFKDKYRKIFNLVIYERYLYGTNTATDEEYLCNKIVSYNEYIISPPIIVILPY